MASNHLVGESSFMKRVLIPFWVVRISVMLIYGAIYLLLIIESAVLLSESRTGESAHNTVFDTDSAPASLAVIVGFAVIILAAVVACLVLDIVCMVKRSRRTLTPIFFLFANIIQTSTWTVLFVLSMIGASSAVSIGIAVIVYLSFVGLLIYAGVIFHKERKGTLQSTYLPANNTTKSDRLTQDTAYASYSLNVTDYPGPQAEHPAYYDPQPLALGDPLKDSQPLPTAGNGNANAYSRA